MSAPALDVRNVSFSYEKNRTQEQRALSDLSFDVSPGQMFAILGPNGSGKTTLFRLISTLAKPLDGDIVVFGHSVRQDRAAVRSMLGIVFQAPSLDGKLTVQENIRCQAALYGLRGSDLKARLAEVVEQLGIEERINTKVEQLSGGLKRRVELAKGMLHRPPLLIMDEPSTGLDPASRLDLWHAVNQLRKTDDVTVVLTTHLLEEAERVDRIAILNEGQLVALGQPDRLRTELGEQVLDVQSHQVEQVTQWLKQHVAEVTQFDQTVRVVDRNAAELVAPLTSELGDAIQSVTLGKPSLEDVFIARTGHRFWNERQT